MAPAMTRWLVLEYLRAVRRHAVGFLTGSLPLAAYEILVIAAPGKEHLWNHPPQGVVWLSVVLALVMAQYFAWRDVRNAFENLRSKRPWLTVDRYDAVYYEDDETGEECFVETLHIVNIGDESAVSIHIEPLTFLGRTAKLLETPGPLRSGCEATFRILNMQYLVRGVRDKMPKLEAGPWSVRLPLKVEYRDLNHRHWSTYHAIVFSAFGISVEIVHPDEPPEWTDVATLATAASAK